MSKVGCCVTIGAFSALDGGQRSNREHSSGLVASSLRMSSDEREALSRVMVYSGQPLREPVVMGGPFVMNSRAEIETAYSDFHAGRFGKVPRQARLRRA